MDNLTWNYVVRVLLAGDFLENSGDTKDGIGVKNALVEEFVLCFRSLALSVSVKLIFDLSWEFICNIGGHFLAARQDVIEENRAGHSPTWICLIFSTSSPGRIRTLFPRCILYPSSFYISHHAPIAAAGTRKIRRGNAEQKLFFPSRKYKNVKWYLQRARIIKGSVVLRLWSKT